MIYTMIKWISILFYLFLVFPIFTKALSRTFEKRNEHEPGLDTYNARQHENEHFSQHFPTQHYFSRDKGKTLTNFNEQKAWHRNKRREPVNQPKNVPLFKPPIHWNRATKEGIMRQGSEVAKTTSWQNSRPGQHRQTFSKHKPRYGAFRRPNTRRHKNDGRHLSRKAFNKQESHRNKATMFQNSHFHRNNGFRKHVNVPQSRRHFTPARTSHLRIGKSYVTQKYSTRRRPKDNEHTVRRNQNRVTTANKRENPNWTFDGDHDQYWQWQKTSSQMLQQAMFDLFD